MDAKEKNELLERIHDMELKLKQLELDMEQRMGDKITEVYRKIEILEDKLVNLTSAITEISAHLENLTKSIKGRQNFISQIIAPLVASLLTAFIIAIIKIAHLKF